MDEVTIVKREIQATEWAARIQACQESGLSIAQWCKQNNVDVRAYYYQLRKLRQKMIEQIPVPVGTTSQLSTPQSSTTPEIKIRLGDAIIKIPDGMSEQTITAIMRALK